MPIKILRRKTLPIGMDLGTSAVKLAQLRIVQDTGIELLAAASAEIPDTIRDSSAADRRPRLEFLADSIRSSLKTNPFQGRACILCLPAAETFLQHVKLPRLDAKDIPNALRGELAGKLPYHVDNAIIRHVVAGDIAGDGEPKQEVIVVAVQRSVMDDYLNMARALRLDVVGVNVEPCAVAECFARLFRRAADAGRATMFIDLGAASTQVVLTHGEKMVFARNLAHGSQQIEHAIAQGMNLSPDQARSLRADLRKADAPGEAEDELYRHVDEQLDLLAGQITPCLRYYDSVFRNQPVERAIFVGGQAYDKRLCQSLAQRLNLPAQVGDPLLRVQRIDGAGLQIGLDRREPQPHWTVAVGLSLGAEMAA